MCVCTFIIDSDQSLPREYLSDRLTETRLVDKHNSDFGFFFLSVLPEPALLA